MIIYLAPTLLVCVLLAAAVRLRRHIEPSCPGCEARAWKDAQGAMACRSCGWSTSPRIAFAPERRTA